jgi:enhancing lycopene biosynthesis protein 2
MPELRSRIPRRIGVLLSAEMLWEDVFSFFYIENSSYMKMALFLFPDEIESQSRSSRKTLLGKLSGLDLEDAAEVKISALQALILIISESEFSVFCDFEAKGSAFGVNGKLRTFLRAVYRRGLPIGAFGFAVPLLVKSIQGIAKTGPLVTVGNNPKLQAGIEASGAQAITTRPTEVIIDHNNKLVTSGGQLGSNRLIEVAADCENMIRALTELIKG